MTIIPCRWCQWLRLLVIILKCSRNLSICLWCSEADDWVRVFSRCLYCSNGQPQIELLHQGPLTSDLTQGHVLFRGMSFRVSSVCKLTDMTYDNCDVKKKGNVIILTSADQTVDMMGRQLKVGVLRYLPFVDYKMDDTPGSTRATPRDSLDVRLLNTVSTHLNFTYVDPCSPSTTACRW